MPVDLRVLALEIHRIAKAYRMSAPGATRLVKLVYLADLEWRRRHSGEPLSRLNWLFSHFGPYAGEFATLFETEEVEATEQHGKNFHRLLFPPEELEKQSVSDEVSCILDGVVREWGDADLNMLLDHVYFETEPMVKATRGTPLDFSTLRVGTIESNPKKLDPQKVAEFRERLRQRAVALGLSREPLRVGFRMRDADEAWNEEFQAPSLPSGMKFKLSDQ